MISCFWLAVFSIFAYLHRCFMVPDHNCSAVCCNCYNCRCLRHKEQNSTSTLHQFSEVWWVTKNTARCRHEFLQSITAPSLADSNENHMPAVKNHSPPAWSFQAALGLKHTLESQFAARTRRFPSRSRKLVATASSKQNWNWNSWKLRRSKFEVTWQMQRNTINA